MPYLILPKDAPIPALFVAPYTPTHYDRWEEVEGVTGQPCPDCRVSLVRHNYTFSFHAIYYCAICSIRRFKCLAERQPISYSTRQLAHVASDPRIQIVVYVPSQTERNIWQAREVNRVSEAPPVGTSSALLDAFPHHYLHMSSTKPGLFAYTKDDEHGYLDKQTILKPGKYLTQYYADTLTTAQIAEIVAACAAYATLGYSLATSTADITAIFNSAQGPSSCMQRRIPAEYDWQKLLDSEELPNHPSAVYGESDLAIAYLGTIGKVSQRAVVWPAKKRYCNYDRVRIYGTGPLERLLQRDGYTAHPDAFHGARIRHIPYRGGVLMPYIDGTATAYVLESHWLILEQRPEPDARSFSTTQTCGCAGACNVPDVEDEDAYDMECSSCREHFNADDIRRGECYECRHSWTCTHCDSRIPEEESSTTVNDENWCDSCVDRDARQCSECDVYFTLHSFRSTLRQTREALGTDRYCADCAEHYAYCDACNTLWNTEELDDCPNTDTHGEIVIKVTDDTDTLPLPLTDDPLYQLEYLSAYPIDRVWRPCYNPNSLLPRQLAFGLRPQVSGLLHWLQIQNPTTCYRIVEYVSTVPVEVTAHV